MLSDSSIDELFESFKNKIPSMLFYVNSSNKIRSAFSLERLSYNDVYQEKKKLLLEIQTEKDFKKWILP